VAVDEPKPMTGDGQAMPGSDRGPSVESSAEGIKGDRPPSSLTARVPRRRPHPIRRVPKPRLTGLLDSPVRNLTVGVAYTLTVMMLATVAYMAAGWSFRDALELENEIYEFKIYYLFIIFDALRCRDCATHVKKMRLVFCRVSFSISQSRSSI
jgi:hypothetical protein